MADFHALRHIFITNLANGGVHPSVAQSLARQSTITRTMDRYSHTLVGEQGEAPETLLNLSQLPPQQARATGTEDAQPGGKTWRFQVDPHLLWWALVDTAEEQR
jgi:hypothetical protein